MDSGLISLTWHRRELLASSWLYPIKNQAWFQFGSYFVVVVLFSSSGINTISSTSLSLSHTKMVLLHHLSQLLYPSLCPLQITKARCKMRRPGFCSQPSLTSLRYQKKSKVRQMCVLFQNSSFSLLIKQSYVPFFKVAGCPARAGFLTRAACDFAEGVRPRRLWPWQSRNCFSSWPSPLASFHPRCPFGSLILSMPTICWFAFALFLTGGFIRGPSALLDNSLGQQIPTAELERAGSNQFFLVSLIISLVCVCWGWGEC